MSNFVLCPECKKYLGKYKLFIEAYTMCVKILKKEQPMDPDNLDMIPEPEINEDIAELMSAIDISNICCRMHTMSNADFFSFIDLKDQV